MQKWIPASSIWCDGSGTCICQCIFTISSVFISCHIKTITSTTWSLIIHHSPWNFFTIFLELNSHQVFICTSVKFKLRERSSRFETERYLSVWNIDLMRNIYWSERRVAWKILSWKKRLLFSTINCLCSDMKKIFSLISVGIVCFWTHLNLFSLTRSFKDTSPFGSFINRPQN